MHYNHDKCKLSQSNTKDNLCQFCLIRSLVIRSNTFSGRAKINPVELAGNNFNELNSLPFKRIVKHVFISLFETYAFLEENFWTIWECSTCYPDNASVYIDFTHPEFQNMDVCNLLNVWEQDFNKNHGQHFDMLQANDNTRVLFVACDLGLTASLTKILTFSGRKWRCKSIIANSQTIFYCNKNYYNVGNDEITLFQKELVDGITFIVYEIIQEHDLSLDDELAYRGDEIKKLTTTLDNRKGDRHTPTSERKGDRHISNKDRHIPTPKRNEDRHTSNKDRHTSNKDRHTNNPKRNRRSYNQKVINSMIHDINTETGMDLICCVCMELKAKSSCSLSSTVSKDKLDKYVLDWERTKNIDGRHYICNTCKISLKNNKEPVRAQRELLGLLGFPDNFKEELKNISKPPNPKKDNKNFTDLNKLEDFLLKLVIPFIRIGHLPRGPHLKVKGDLIMISSNLSHSLNMILPQSQDLIPVSFKRKLEYKGYYIEEYVDRDKLHAYFNFFKKYNHLFKDFEFNDAALDEFEKEMLKKINIEHDSDDSEMDIDPEKVKNLLFINVFVKHSRSLIKFSL